VVENIQVLVAAHARQAWNAGPDFFGEEHLLCRLAKALEEKGWSKEDAEHLATSLKRANYSLQVIPLSLSRGWALATPAGAGPEGPEGTDIEADDEDEEAGENDAWHALEAAEPEPEMLEVLDAQDEIAKVAEQPEAAPWGYVVSKTRGGRHRKLHHVGSCRLVPGVDYKEYDTYGALMPDASELDSKCSWCFGAGSLLKRAEKEESAEESQDSSSSTSSGKLPEKKRRKKQQHV
jgi:hypothetical protein